MTLRLGSPNTLGLPRSGRVSAVTILVAIVMLLVPALAWMQYQWLGQLSTAERERMQRTLRTAAAQFATEFDTEISRTLVTLQVDGQTLRDQNWTAYAQRYSAWASGASEPRLVKDLWLVDTLPGTTLPSAFAADGFAGLSALPIDRLRLRKWNAQSLAFEEAAWPPDLSAVREGLLSRFIGFQVQRERNQSDALAVHREASMSISVGDDNTLIAPVTLFALPDDRQGPPRISVLGFTIVRLDPAVVRDTILASLTSRHFHGEDAEADYRVAVVQRADASNVVWESEAGAASLVTTAPDVTQAFMGPRPDQMFVFASRPGNRDRRTGNREDVSEELHAGSRPPVPGSRMAAPGSRFPVPEPKIVVSMIEREDRAGAGRIITRSGQFGAFEGKWLLMAKHRAGSLEAAVASVRQRNLWISSSVLLLLTMAIGLIVVSARRAQALARQQMEFVAAVSHELRTPVSVIGAAAGNLADGVVGDPLRVRKYGETIQGEARRLAETVERVLQLAGIAAGRAAAAQVPVNPADLVHDSIGACRTEIENAGFTVEVAIAESLPNVVGDVTALKSALQNVISNAVKYGGDARWLRVGATREPGTGNRERVLFNVDDHGIGITAEDKKHIFEPFYRGRDAVAQQIQGSGLGLNLVMRIVAAHGGHVMVQSEAGKGSTFILALPAASESESVSLVREATSPR